MSEKKIGGKNLLHSENIYLCRTPTPCGGAQKIGKDWILPNNLKVPWKTLTPLFESNKYSRGNSRLKVINTIIVAVSLVACRGLRLDHKKIFIPCVRYSCLLKLILRKNQIHRFSNSQKAPSLAKHIHKHGLQFIIFR